MIDKINKFVDKNVVLIFTIFIFIQPFLDALTGIMLYSFNSNITFSSIIRILFFVFCIYYLLFIGNKKNKKVLYILLLYSSIFLIVNVVFKMRSNFYLEFKYLLNSIYFPVLLMFIFEILKDKHINKINLFKTLIIYILLIFIPNIFNIGFDSYAYSKTGSNGFFYSANAIGNIISIISPLYLSYLIINKKRLYLLVFLIMYIYILVTLGTKAPLLCALIIFIYFIISYTIKLFKAKKYIYLSFELVILIVITFTFINIIPKTPFYKNLVIHLEYLKIESLSDLLTLKNIDHFLFGSRLTFFKEELNIFNNSNIFQKLFGIGYSYENKLMKIAEMDYFDTFIHHGIFGFLIIYLNYFIMLINIFKCYLKKFNKNFLDINKSLKVISIVISILCALLTGHELATPSVSIFVSLIIVIVYNEFHMYKENDVSNI